jgi:Domain of unknown function (DUF4124)
VTRFAAAVLLILTWPAQAQMYKCVDERGVTSYSATPRPDCKGGKKVDIQGSPPISGSVAPRSANVPQQDSDFKRRQIEREQAEAKDKMALGERCARLRSEESMLSSGMRVFKSNERGERVYIEDATRDSRLAAVREELRRCP